MRLGAPVFIDSQDPEEIARAHRALGYRAGYCPHVELEDGARIRAIREAFAKHDVVIGEIGVWNNLLDADEAKRSANLAAMKRALALADEVGALCDGDFATAEDSEALEVVGAVGVRIAADQRLLRRLRIRALVARCAAPALLNSGLRE